MDRSQAVRSSAEAPISKRPAREHPRGKDRALEIPKDVLNRVPPLYRQIYKQAMTGRSRRMAVRAFCLECMGWSANEVRDCTAPYCPLYPYRLLQPPRSKRDKVEPS